MDYLRRTPVIEIDLPGEADTQALGRAIAEIRAALNVEG